MYGFGTFTWKERREANKLTYLVKLFMRARKMNQEELLLHEIFEVLLNENNSNELLIQINCIINWWTKFYIQSDCLLIT